MAVDSIKEVEPDWTDFELKLESFRKSKCQELNQNFLKNRIRYRMVESSLGDFLFHLNSGQLQKEHVQRDKLERVRFDIAAGLKNPIELARKNDICEDILGLVEKLLKGNFSGKITVGSVLRNVDVLRLAGSEVQQMDKSLKFSENLRCLILAGCCVQDFPSEFLPRGLMMLELYCNQMERLDLFISSCPTNILYLGLGRNYLTQGVLGPLSKLEFLLHLDLTDNEIEDLHDVVSACKSMTALSSLMLQGNPCSYLTNYSHTIATFMPKLFFLDGEVLKRSAEQINATDYKETTNMKTLFGTLQISLFRMMSLPQPKNEKINKKKVTHTFRVEVICPLLLKYIPKTKESFIKLKTASIASNKNVNITKNKRGSNKPLKESRKRKTSKSSGKTDSTAAKGKESNIIKNLKKVISANDKKEEDLETELFDESLCFASERKKWSKIMEFPQPTIEIPCCELTLLRNVFRSNMIIYITHLKTLPPVRAKIKTKMKKSIKSNEIEESPENKQEPKEILVSKTMVAKFKIPLHSILWNNKSLDYSWSKSFPTRIVEEQAPLKEQKYVVKKKQTKSKKGKEEDSTEIQIPKEFTVHVGVGVKRRASN